MKWNKKDIRPQYDKDVEKIRAIALTIFPEELSISNLAKAMLISKNGRKALAEELGVEEYLLRKPLITIGKNIKDDPRKKWPESLVEEDEDEDDSELDKFLLSIDDEDEKIGEKKELYQKKEVEYVSLDFLIKRVAEKRGKEYFLKKELANNEKEFTTLINKAKENLKSAFPRLQKQMSELLDLIEINYLKNYRQTGLDKPNPIFIFSADDNDDFEIIDYLKKQLECRAEIFDLETSSLSGFPKKLSDPPPALVFFQLSKFVAENNQVISLLSYYETGIAVRLEDESSSSFIDFLDSEASTTLQQITNQNIVFFLIKLPKEFKGYNNLSFEELTFSLQNYYAEKYKYLESRIDPSFNIRLLHLAKNFNAVLFPKLSFNDAELIIGQHLLQFGYDISELPEEKKFIINSLIVLLAGGLKKSLLKHATDYFLKKIDPRAEGLSDISFNIDCQDNSRGKVFEENSGNYLDRRQRFQLLLNNFEKSNKWVSFTIISEKSGNNVIVKNFKEYSNPGDTYNYLQERPNIRFSDVVGLEEIKNRFKTIGQYYQNPELFQQLKVAPNNRILLTGKPGTGKTMIAKAFAGELGLPFFYVSASELTSQKYAGYGGSLLRQLFQVAKSQQPCILFIDELDTIGNRESLGEDSVGFDAKSIINTLLVELDGINSHNDIIVVGATNRPQDIDEALTRPKRFGTILKTDDFTTRDRQNLIKSKLKPEMCMDSYEDILKIFIDRTGNDFTPAILEEMINEAKLLAIKDRRSKVAVKDISKAIDTLVLGNKLNEVDSALKKSMAYHQAGHALLHKIFFKEKEIEKLSVSIYQNSIGIMQTKEDDSLMKQYTIEELMKMMVVQLGGAVCEEQKFGSWGLIAENDWEFITFIATKIIGNIILGGSLNPIIEYYLSPDSITDSNVEIIKQLINYCYQITSSSLKEYWIDIELLAKKLMENGELTGIQVDEILAKVVPNSENLFEGFRRNIGQFVNTNRE